MSPKKGDPVAPPPDSDEYEIRYAHTEAVRGWQELGNHAQANTAAAWETMRANPGPYEETSRHHRLRRELGTVSLQGKRLPQWQIEVTGGGRVWYAIDRDRMIVWLTYASAGHPKATE